MVKQLIKDIYYAFPIQLFLLHFRKFQVLLIFWWLLFSIVNSGFLKKFGTDALFFAPEYLGAVNFLGALITGSALGFFFMSWNITTFILHSKRFKFLATTTKPFFKYCINNSVFPLLFTIFYFVRLSQFDGYRELMSSAEIFQILSGLLIGCLLSLLFTFLYFYGAEKQIIKTIAPIVGNPEMFNKRFSNKEKPNAAFGMKVSYYLTGKMRFRKARSVVHYRQDFLDAIFKRHHMAAILSIILAFLFLVMIGFLLENRYFEMPAAASILIFLSIMIAVIGALTYFLKSWSLPAVIVLILVLNFLYRMEWIDPRNKAYGLNYLNKTERPAYSKASLQALCTPDQIVADKANMIRILEKWKKRQRSAKPVICFINVSGGGLRSATFVMNSIQKIDSITGGRLMQQTFLISGASGGMLSATYYRELYRKKLIDPSLNISDSRYTESIARDLLNPVFTSMIARDLFAPIQHFEVDGRNYVKDRGYAFEKKLSDNTNGIINIQLKDLKKDEQEGKIPLIFFNSVIKSDGRKLYVGTQPMSFMMKPVYQATDTQASPDAVDFNSLFTKQDPLNLRVLTALRMNATFPYVLPNVWLPSNPVVDVMDAGLRDNFGQETALRFIDNFREWIAENTSGVLLVQFRDRPNDNWQYPFETNSVSDMFVTPATMLQHNWFKFQDYAQNDQYSYLASKDSLIKKLMIMYTPEKLEKGAALNFHLSAREKRDIFSSFYTENNKSAMKQILYALDH
jgi:hypothetical protein